MTVLSVSSVFSQGVSVGKAAKDNSVEAQLAAFRVHEDFEVNLFADETMGIANPVAMHWDERGRLWVLTTLTYAQLEPGETPNDTLVVLEDTDEDGRADKSTVFADGLEMPMGFALGDGGVYLGEGPDLLFLEDVDEDGRADRREVLLTGFGTGDTHQNISNFTWGPDGCLYFSQGLHCYSRVETPWGIVRGDTAGFFRFHPGTLRLEPFCFPSLCSQNPCGIAFDQSGALFIKSNNRELIYATPGLIPTMHQKNLAPIGTIGATPGKSMGGECVNSPHLPEWIQNNILIAGYYSHRVSAFPLVPEGAGYAEVEPVEVLFSEHGSFRPVEIRIGPDGAIYVADWYNPIIGHYQASLRHPDRDEKHGRVWRITAKGRELKKPNRWPQRKYHLTSDVEDKLPFGMLPQLTETGLPLPSRSEQIVSSRSRLNEILAAANSGNPNSISVALAALDHPRDRFLDYALEQTVHALAPVALPAIASGEVTFENPEHLAYFLETLGGESALNIARARLDDESLSSAARMSLSKVLARSGTPADLLYLLSSNPDVEILSALVEASRVRKVRPAEGFVPVLRTLCESEKPSLRLEAVRLAGAWKVRPLSNLVKTGFLAEEADPQFLAAAAKALAGIEGQRSVDLLLGRFQDAPLVVKVAIVESVAPLAPARASAAVASELVASKNSGQVAAFLRPVMSQKGAAAELLKAMKATPPDEEAAGHLISALSQIGANDEALLGYLQDVMGVAAGSRAYSPGFVSRLVAEVSEKGDAGAGKEIYQRAELTCVACHQLEDVGGIIGPSLDAVGAGLSPDLLIESVLWPQRQLKEGYFAVAVNTKGGATYSGYREKEQDGIFYLRDTATGEVREIPRVEISRIENIGSLMPQGLTNSLSREELTDLIAYLATLRG